MIQGVIFLISKMGIVTSRSINYSFCSVKPFQTLTILMKSPKDPMGTAI